MQMFDLKQKVYGEISEDCKHVSLSCNLVHERPEIKAKICGNNVGDGQNTLGNECK